jgi:drug/metabolite transporter (DMT)-like permease
MPLHLMFLVLFAALLHASWNFLIKRNDDKYLAMSAVVLGHAPLALLAAVYAPWPALAALPYLLAGSALHLGYQFFLLAAYRAGDLSQVYPLARGVAPLLVALVSLLALGHAFGRLQLAAIGVIAIGIMSLAGARQGDGLRNGRAALLALATGGFIAGYSLVDGLGARAAGTALGFYGWLSVLNAAAFALIMWRIRPGMLRAVLRKGRRLALVGGSTSFISYAIATWAFTVAPIALVAALRETGIIFALLLGVFVLRERFTAIKALATALTVIGVVLLRLAG